MKREECMEMLNKQIDAAWAKFRNSIKDAIDRAYAEGKRNAELTVGDVTKMIQDALDHHVSWPTTITYPSWPSVTYDYGCTSPVITTAKNDKVTLNEETDWR